MTALVRGGDNKPTPSTFQLGEDTLAYKMSLFFSFCKLTVELLLGLLQNVQASYYELYGLALDGHTLDGTHFEFWWLHVKFDNRPTPDATCE